MIFIFQSNYTDKVAAVLSDKDHVSDGIDHPYFLNIILLLSLFFVVLSCLFILLMIYSRVKRNKQQIIDSCLMEKYQDFLSSFLLLPNDEAFLGIQKNTAMDVRLSKKDVTDKHCRTILAKEIYDLKKMVRGQQESQLSNYFYGLGLQEEVSRLLASSNWTNKVKAMQMIRSFDIQELMTPLNQYITHKNRELSIHAISARIAIDKNLEVLETLKYNLNLWEIHKVYEIIHSRKIPMPFLQKLCNEHRTDKTHFSHQLLAAFEPAHRKLELA